MGGLNESWKFSVPFSVKDLESSNCFTLAARSFLLTASRDIDGRGIFFFFFLLLLVTGSKYNQAIILLSRLYK